MIQVVSGVLRAGDTCFMQKRDQASIRPDLWEFPGGKVEPGESHEEALTREWREEVGVDVRVGQLIAAAVLDVEVSFVVHLYEVSEAGAPVIGRSIMFGRMGWFAPLYAVTRLPCSPGFYLSYAAIARWMEGR